MCLNETIEILKMYFKVDVKMDVGEIKPRPWILTLTRGSLLAFHLFYGENPELPISKLNDIGISLNLPNQWWENTP